MDSITVKVFGNDIYIEKYRSFLKKGLVNKQEAPGSPYSCAEGYKLYKIGTQGVHVRQAI